MKQLQKRDIILAAVILLAAAAAFGYNRYARRAPAVLAQVSVNGEVTEVLDLAEDREITVTSENSGTNRLIVKDGEIWCSEASCPDKICVRQGHKSLSSDTIVCLPNQMIVTIIGAE